MCIFVLLLFNSCTKEDLFYPGNELDISSDGKLNNDHLKKATIANNNWRQQLESILSDTLEILNLNEISLHSYEFVDSINSDDDVNLAKLNIQSDNSFVPLYAGSLKKIVPITMKEAKISNSAIQQFDPARLKTYLDINVKPGLKKLKLNWNYKSMDFSSICLVSEEKGIVYDNLISNIMIVKQCSKQSNSISYSPLILKTANIETDNGSISYYNGISMNAYWLWGSDRGNATVNYNVGGHVQDGIKYIDNHYENASCNMTIGTCDAKITVKSFETGSGGHYECVYGWYLASPLVSISMSYNGSGYNINVGVSLGSEAHNVGGAYVSTSQLY